MTGAATYLRGGPANPPADGCWAIAGGSYSTGGGVSSFLTGRSPSQRVRPSKLAFTSLLTAAAGLVLAAGFSEV